MKNTVLFFLLVMLVSCVDHTFDEPPGFMPEVVETNAVVGDLLDRWIPGQFVQITDELTFEGTVVANDESGNFYKQLVIEDVTGAIQVRLDAIGLYNEYPIGRSVVIKSQGLYISDYEGLPQLSAAEGSGSNVGSIPIPEPLIPEFLFNTASSSVPQATNVEINELDDELLNRFVKLDEVQFTVGDLAKPLADAANQFSANRDIEDCDENVLIVRTSGYASFASTFVPGGKGSIEGILSVFRGSYQLLLIDTDGMDMEGERCDGSSGNNGGNNGGSGDPVSQVDEDFESQSDNQDINITDWLNLPVKGTRKWRAKEFDGNVYAQATAFNDTNDEMEAWLITPKIKFDSPMILELRTAVAFHVHNGLTVWYSNDFDGTDVRGATWKELEFTKAGSSNDNYDWVSSGEVDLSEISGEAHIGFMYEGNPTSGTTSVIIDDVKIVEK